MTFTLRSPAAPHRSARLSLGFATGGVLLTALYAGNLLGPAEQLSVILLGALALLAIPLGIHRHRPARSLPWVIMATAVALLLIELGVRGRGATAAHLQSQPMITALVQLPGYLLLAVAATMLAQPTDPSERGNLDMILDGVIATMAALTMSWVFLIGPLLTKQGISMPSRLLLATFPPLDVYLVMLAFRIGFSPRSRRATSGRFFLISVVMMLVGDVAYMMSQLEHLHPPLTVLALPYLLAATALGSAALHPSMRQLSVPKQHRVGGVASIPSRGRLTLVALGLIAPSLVVVSDRLQSTGNRVAFACIALITVSVATWRMVRALHATASSEAKLAYQATHDELTGLPNRMLIEQWISQRLDEPKLSGVGIGVAFLDVDRFKLINDTFGHSHGDLLLVEVARRLADTIEHRDLVARIGGDEFIIVFNAVSSAEHARRAAERVHECFSKPFVLGDSDVFVTASLGVSLPTTDGSRIDAETLIRDADTAMYQAKEGGRDTVAVFDISMRERIADRLALEHDLRLAVEREEFRLVYQPIVSLADSDTRVIGMEALLRWEGPTRGLVPPGMFISIAEDSGLIVEIGDWVIHEACRQLARWRQEPGMEKLFVSVNVSALQLKKSSLFARVRSALAQEGLAPDALCIELTESLLMESPTDGTVLLARMKDLGVRLALDDFGTGYSSLAYLRQFPVDFVKIDKSFIDGLVRHDSSEETLVAAIVSMAGALGAVTIAEGVEELEQDERLRDIGADCAQGFFYARPIASDQVIEKVRELTPNRGLRLVSGESAAGR